MMAYFVFKMGWISRLFLVELAFLGFIFLFFIRLLEFRVFKSYRAKGYNHVNVVLIADDSSEPFIDSLLINKEWGYTIIALFTSSDLLKSKYEKSLILLPEEYLNALNDLMVVDIIDEILYIKTKVISAQIRSVVRSCEELGVTFRLKVDDKKPKITNAIETNIANQKFLNFINVPYNSYALAVKKIMDINVSLIMIVMLSPVFVGVAMLIKFTSNGPVVYKQKRVGLRGRHFNLFKFRTMVVNADIMRKELEGVNEADGPVFKMKDDPRLTKIGGFLRKTGLDELPQLFNILRGEMSLIGPRPPLQSETIQYERWQLRRLSVKPGLSCFWQIKPYRNQIKFDEWMEMDLAYIDNWSLRLDLVILIKTIKTVFQRTGL
jgi:exopolysaccharide biosynthesis polyprenyl glycosylphosphotransferase